MIVSESPAETHDVRSAPRQVPRWVDRWGSRVMVIGLALLLAATGVWILAYSHQVDLSIYRFGGLAILHGPPLYDYGLTGRPHALLFNYPPFAAIVLSPLALLP